jgi:signal transduction histidine kinase
LPLEKVISGGQTVADQAGLRAARAGIPTGSCAPKDWQNPLSAISNALQVSRRTSSEENAQWSEDVIERQVNQLTHLIDDLLDVSRIAQGKIQLRIEYFDPSPVIARRCRIARRPHESNALTPTVSVAEPASSGSWDSNPGDPLPARNRD